MRLRFIKKITILSSEFSITYDKKSTGGSFSWNDSKIIIGIKSYPTDPLYTISVLSHELMELILAVMGARYESNRDDNNYLFNYNHQVFETSIQVFTQALNEFII